MSQIITRPVPLRVHDQLVREGLHPVLARVCAARGISRRGELEDALSGLIPPSGLLNADRAAALLADAIAAGKRMLIVADYYSDGATACAVGMRALSAFGANVGYLVPNRFEFGYGLTPEIVALAARSKPELLITVDNGIASVEGVEAAGRLGIEVIVTDHHLPGSELPRAAAIVNPNQPGCPFSSKSLAGVGVMFYVMLALRAELRKRGWFTAPSPLAPLPEGEGNVVSAAGRQIRIEPNLGDVLDLVALGTVADVVPLDFNNRVLVAQGLRRIRAGRMHEGMRALFAVAGRDPTRASGFDLGFLLGPRLNAAGRLSDMSLGIECLTTGDRGRALEIARQLDDLNRERRTIEADMQAQADELMAKLSVGGTSSISLYDPSWHQGVVGILAGRVKDRHHRPTFAFAPAARLRVCICATRWISSRSANRTCSRASAGTPQRRASRCARRISRASRKASRPWRASCFRPRSLRARSRPTVRWNPRISISASRNCSTPKSGDRVFRSRCSATSSRCSASAWSARNT